MRVMILGAWGYLGWPTCMRMSMNGHEVIAVDNYYKKGIEKNKNVHPLRSPKSLEKRCKLWKEVSGREIEHYKLDVCSPEFHNFVFVQKPDVIIHYAEQPSAPYSMTCRNTCIDTFQNNIIGTLNILWAIKDTDIHLIKLGTMGEYGTPGIHIEEGWVEILDNYFGIERKARLPFPKQPGSFYHASKVADSVNLELVCRIWDLSVTDLNQGVVYGTGTRETRMNDGLFTSFHYDSILGTALNRFIAQAIVERPITVYGEGKQKRGWLHIEDTLQCVNLAMLNPPKNGEFRVLNQFSEIFTVLELAEKVHTFLGGEINHVDNPRVELEDHYYSASNNGLLNLGFNPRRLDSQTILNMAEDIRRFKERIREHDLFIKIDWR